MKNMQTKTRRKRVVQHQGWLWLGGLLVLGLLALGIWLIAGSKPASAEAPEANKILSVQAQHAVPDPHPRLPARRV